VDTPSDDPFSLHVHRPWVDATWAMARERVPAMAHAHLDDGAHWAGLYEMSPDKTVCFGYDPACPNLLLVNGSSGHGVMHSPILGELAAEWLVTGRVTSMDVRPLRPTRFAEGDPNPVNDLL
jgi:sarcosine oxidase subunit beta